MRTQREGFNFMPALRMNKWRDDGMLHARWLMLVSWGSRDQPSENCSHLVMLNLVFFLLQRFSLGRHWCLVIAPMLNHSSILCESCAIREEARSGDRGDRRNRCRATRTSGIEAEKELNRLESNAYECGSDRTSSVLDDVSI